MSAGLLKVDAVTWRERTVAVRGTIWYMGTAPVVATLAYAHVAGVMLQNDYSDWHVVIGAGPVTYSLLWLTEAAARDFAAELARRMEAVR